MSEWVNPSIVYIFTVNEYIPFSLGFPEVSWPGSMDNSTSHYKVFQKTTQQTSNIIKLFYVPSFLYFIYINSFNQSNNACRIDITINPIVRRRKYRHG